MILYALGAAYASSSLRRLNQDDLLAPSNNFPTYNILTNRSIYGIIWSCLATIFACTWISVHPNLPAPQDGALRVVGRRMAIMAYLLIAPEMIIMWTTRQYLAASEISKRHKDKGWKKTHAFFLLMGGFSLYENGVLLRTLEAREFERLVEEGKIDWPTITEEEINDKSKGDPFSKGIALLQTSWFIVQCIVRGAKHLVLTELEVVTLAFATIAMGIYALWWNKPLDVQVAVPVHLKQQKLVEAEDHGTDEDVDRNSKSLENVGVLQAEQSHLQSPDAQEDKPYPTTSESGVEAPNGVQTEKCQLRKPDALDEMSTPGTSVAEVSDSSQPIAEKLESPPPAHKKPFHDPNLTPWQNLRAYMKAKRKERGLFSGMIYVFIVRPGTLFFGPFSDMMECTTLEGKQYRVPTFYAPAVADDSTSIAFALLVAVIFGGIHCIAWNFYFATWTERWIWRISAVLVCGLPISMTLLSAFVGNDDEYNSRWTKLASDMLIFVLVSSAILYICARIALLLLPLIALRALPRGAYIAVNWIAYLPHI